MKSKLIAGKLQQNKKIESTPNPQTVQGQEIPPGLEYFAEMKGKTHAEQFAEANPKFAMAVKNKDTEKLAGFAGTFSGLGLDLGVPVPEWAKAASKEFWKGMGFDFLTVFKSHIWQIGKLVGLVDHAHKNDKPSKPEQAAFAFAQHTKAEVVNASPDELLEFAKARKDSAKIFEKAQGMSQRTIIFGIIAAGWREVEKFESSKDFYYWLMTLKNSDGPYTLARATDSREIRKICNRIGLQFQNQWTVPNPGHAKKTEARPRVKI